VKKIRRQVILLTLSLITILAICGAVAAADESSGNTTNGSEVDISSEDVQEQGTTDPTEQPNAQSEANPDPPLDITKGSWDIAGLDSNFPVTQGPNQTVIQFRIRNPDLVNTAHDVTATFAWTSANIYIDLAPGETAIKNLGDIAPGQTKDVFYLVEITRTSLAHFTSRDYQVTIAGSDTPTYTPGGSIYVEKLLSQNRNDITGIMVSPPNPTVGSTFTVTVTSTTGSPNYPELALSLVLYDPAMVMPLVS